VHVLLPRVRACSAAPRAPSRAFCHRLFEHVSSVRWCQAHCGSPSLLPRACSAAHTCVFCTAPARVLTLLHPCGGAPCCSRTWTFQCTFPACPAPLPPRRAHAIPSPAPTTTYSVPLLCMSAGDHPRVSAGAHEFYNVTRQRTLIRPHPLPSLHTHRQPPNT
jgi:hypothetical protein